MVFVSPNRRALLVALVAALGLPSGAQAAKLDQPLKPCYVSAGTEQEPIRVVASGFTPRALVDIVVDGVPFAAQEVRADDSGMVNGQVLAPAQPEGERPFAMTVSERDRPENTVIAASRVTVLAIATRPARARPSRRVTFSGRGFTGAGPVWAHYVFGSVQRRAVRLAVPSGPCGTFRVRRRQMPIRRPRTGTWTLQVDQQRAYAQTPSTNVFRINITVTRTPRSP